MTQDLKLQDERLGKCERVFKPTSGNIVAGFIISLLLVLAGLAAIFLPLRDANSAGWNLPFYVEKGSSWAALVGLCVFGAILIAGGIALAMFARFLLSHRVDVCANGFRFFSRGGPDDVLWADISLIRESIHYARPPLLKGAARFLLPKVASTSYTVIMKDGKEYSFDGNSTEGIKLLGLIFRRHADRVSVPWESIETKGR